PVVNGTAKVGQTLNVSNGTWTGDPTGYRYHWQRCTSASSCTNISGATSQTYVIHAADAGDTLRAVVTATNAAASSTANPNMSDTAAASGAPTSPRAPSTPGDAVVGSTLTADPGTWSGTPTGYRYQWLQCDGAGGACVQVTGATGKTYGVRLADVYSTLRV